MINITYDAIQHGDVLEFNIDCKLTGTLDKVVVNFGYFTKDSYDALDKYHKGFVDGYAYGLNIKVPWVEDEYDVDEVMLKSRLYLKYLETFQSNESSRP